ncbi:hypothetical protein LFL97_13385 [Burkholderia sp. JSH-S8]|nr:hypothetical protein LFL97_13385 [Burkholderia sp. JSH-S8]
MAASTIAEKLGMSDGSVDAVKAALGGQPMTPEQLLALKQADADFELKMRQAGFTHAENMAGIQVQADRVTADDRASARQYAAAEHDHTARNLAYMYTVALFVVIGLEFYLAIGAIKMPDVVKSTLDTLLGVLITMVIGLRVIVAGGQAGGSHHAVCGVAGYHRDRRTCRFRRNWRTTQQNTTVIE